LARPKGNPIDAVVGQNLQRIRKSRGISQTALGEALGISFPQIQKYETGINRVSASALYEMARALGVSLDDLFSGAEQIFSNDPTREPNLAGRRPTEIDQIQNPAIREAMRSLITLVSGPGTQNEVGAEIAQ
jgi:transcriptional regulator with XRE-family HTH domain